MNPERRKSAGGIVVNEHGEIALVRARNGDGSFLFPKGGIEAGESAEEAARREVAEEAGLHDLKKLEDLGVFERFAIKPSGSYNRALLIEIHMFLFTAAPGAPLAPTMEMDAAKWVLLSEATTADGNEKEREWLTKMLPRIREVLAT